MVVVMIDMYEETIIYNGKLILGARVASAFLEYLHEVEGWEVKIEKEWRNKKNVSIFDVLMYVLPPYQITVRF